MRRLRKTINVLVPVLSALAILIGVSSAFAGAPVVTRAEFESYFSTDWDTWARQAKFAGGPLGNYNGDLSDHRAVAEYLVLNQYLMPGDVCNGGWKGGNPGEAFDYVTNDEGTSAKAVILLGLIMSDFGGKAWAFEHPTAGRRNVGAALWDGVRFLQTTQFRPLGGVDIDNKIPGNGVPGPWVQYPGWQDGRTSHLGGGLSPLDQRIGGLRTYNDGVSSMPVTAMTMLQALGLTDDRTTGSIVLAAKGTAYIQDVNAGAIPEQVDMLGHACWGRGHEPPCVSPMATACALDIYVAARMVAPDDTRWSFRTLDTQEWLKATQGDDGLWDYFLEVNDMLKPEHLRPLWGDGNYRVVWSADEAEWPTSHPGSREKTPAGRLYRLNRWFEYLNAQRE